jgi:hypothetical protein
MPNISLVIHSFQFSFKRFSIEIQTFFKNVISKFLKFYSSSLFQLFQVILLAVYKQCFFVTCIIEENLVMQQQSILWYKWIMGLDLLLLKSELYYLQFKCVTVIFAIILPKLNLSHITSGFDIVIMVITVDL